MTARYDIVIVGAGHAGAAAAAALRQKGHAGTIALIGDERDLPYERPPLSKEYLAGEKSFERLLIRPPAFWSERGIEMLRGTAVVSVDAARHVLGLADGKEVEFGTLIWATGGSPRLLTCDGHHLAGVHAVRTRADVDRLAAELDAEPRIAVVGGGYIGLEAAAALVKRGLDVTVLEAAPRVLARVAGPDLSAFYEAQHAGRGVRIRTGVTVSCLLGDERVTGVLLATGERIPAELVIVGIGIVPAVQPLLDAGAAGGDGVEVDDYCRTDLPDIYAIGDCARHPNAHAGGRMMRLESVQNANDMAVIAARSILGDPEPYRALPWFWSNQYDLKLQTVGLSIGHDAAVTRGTPSPAGFSIVYLREGRVIALDCVNATRDYVQGRRLVEAGATIDPATLADATVPLKDMLDRQIDG